MKKTLDDLAREYYHSSYDKLCEKRKKVIRDLYNTQKEQ